MSKPEMPNEGPGAEPRESPTAVAQPKKRRPSKKTVENALAIGAAALGAMHYATEIPRADTSQEADPGEAVPGKETIGGVERPEWKYNAVGQIVRETVFHDDVSTGGVQDNFVTLFETAFTSPEGTCTYYDAKGNVLLSATVPESLMRLKESIRKESSKEKPSKKTIAGLKKTLEGEMQKWHNENRKACSAKTVTPSDYNDSWAYPFLATPISSESGSGSLFDDVRARLDERTHTAESGPSYFDGKERSVYDAISDIAKAYDIPLAIVLGIAANESAFKQMAESSAGARGIYQFTERGFNDAKKYVASHPELGASVRAGSIGTYADSWKNRFVSAELFCAYYLLIQGRMREKLDELETRLLTMDPSFPVGTFLDIATINAYNAGDSRIRTCIDRFLSLSDEQIRSHVGEPPYGADVWLAVTGLSLGLTDDGTFSQVGKDVFQYPQKVLAMGALIMDAENAMSSVNRERGLDEEEIATQAPATVPTTRRGFWQAVSAITGFGGVVAGILSGRDTRKDVVSREAGTGGITRRDMMKMTAAGIGALAPTARAGSEWMRTRKNVEPEDFSDLGKESDGTAELEIFEEVATKAKESIDALYANLLLGAASKKTGWLPEETRYINLYTVPKNRSMLAGRFQEMFGKKLVEDFKASEKESFRKRAHLYDEARAKQEEYVRREVASGEFVRLEEDDPSNPYFCEQVNRTSGIENDPDALFLRKEFIPLIGTLVTVVNYQIDLFNANPTTYGIQDENFPVIPHISALKISGALRSTLTTKKMFEQGKGSATTTGMTPHWLGSAMDIGSFATVPRTDKQTGLPVGPMGHMARLDGYLKDAKDGVVMVQRGEKLDNGGFGTRTREILSKMIGRALFAMRDPLLSEQRIEIQPKWESPAKNWHVALEVNDAKEDDKKKNP